MDEQRPMAPLINKTNYLKKSQVTDLNEMSVTVVRDD